MSESVVSRSALNLRPSVFAELMPRIQALDERCIPLHIGDTYRLPPKAARQALREAALECADSTRFFQYTHPVGRPELLQALAAKLEADNGIHVTPDCLQMTCGATQALSAVAQTHLDPGDEVIVCCPYWPLIRGIIETVGGVVVYASLKEATEDPEGCLGSLVSDRTKAIYLANPNNPDGRLLNLDQARGLHRFASSKGLLLWSDEAYEHIVFDGREKVSLQSLDKDSERPCVVSVFTFSKSFGMAGLRIGYVAGPKDFMPSLRRVCNHQIYNLSDLVQGAALAALSMPPESYRAFLDTQRDDYQKARDLLATAFPKAEVAPGGAYLFLEFESVEQSWLALNAWLAEGLCSAPGEAFGPLHHHYLRLCFTAVAPERLEDAVAIVKRVRY